MLLHVAVYDHGVLDGLPMRGVSAEKKTLNRQKMLLRLRKNWQDIRTANILEGLVVHSHQKFVGTFVVEGSRSKVNILDDFLRDRNMGKVGQDLDEKV